MDFDSKYSVEDVEFTKGFVDQYGPDFYILLQFEQPLKILRKKDGTIPRPLNCYMLFRSYVVKYAQQRELKFEYKGLNITLSSSQNYLGKVSAFLWRNLPIDKKIVFYERYEEMKQIHESTYPDYKYSPKRQSYTFKLESQTEKNKKSKTVEAQYPVNNEENINSQANQYVIQPVNYEYEIFYQIQNDQFGYEIFNQTQNDQFEHNNFNQIQNDQFQFEYENVNQIQNNQFEHDIFNQIQTDQFLGAYSPLSTNFPSPVLSADDVPFIATPPSQWLNYPLDHGYDIFNNSALLFNDFGLY
jgi:hypothetical protein